MQAGGLNMVGSQQGKKRCGVFGREHAFFRGKNGDFKALDPCLSGSVSPVTSAKVVLASAAIHLTLPPSCEQRSLFTLGGLIYGPGFPFCPRSLLSRTPCGLSMLLIHLV